MTISLPPFKYPAVKLRKDSWPFSIVTFYAEAGDLYLWTGVYRKQISQQGYQRMLKDEHASQIRKFLVNEANVIPNSVVLAFNDHLDVDGTESDGAVFQSLAQYTPSTAGGEVDKAVGIDTGILSVHIHPRLTEQQDTDDDVTLSDFRSAYVIDGQHRIVGGNAAGTNIYLPVTAFIGIDREEQAFHFIVINRKARRVNKHEIDAVIPKNIYEGLQKRLVDAGIVSTDADIVFALDNLSDSPFKGLVSWPNNTTGTAVFSKGAIDSLIKESRRLPKDELEAFDDNEIDLLIAMWNGVRRHLEKLWTSRHFKRASDETYENQLLIKAAGVLPAIQRMLVNAFEQGGLTVKDSDPDPKAAFAQAVYDYVKTIPLEIFYCTWKPSSITNEARIDDLAKQLTKAKRTKRVPYGGEWFAEAESLETAAAKKKAEREQKKKNRAAAKKAKSPKKRKPKKAR